LPHAVAGRPVPLGRGLPWRWTVCPRLAGEIVAVVPVADPGQTAHMLAQLVAVL
jgi:hypothetical protein